MRSFSDGEFDDDDDRDENRDVSNESFQVQLR
jgi:hypothetical protein